MAKINLRPWREELRAERQKQFVTMLFLFLLLSAAAGFLWYQHVLGTIEYQKQRNNYISSEIKLMDKQIKEINELRKRRDALLERMRVIQDLQGKRPIIVRLFDELVRNVPEGVYLTNWTKKSVILQLKGVGDSNSRISSLMRSLDGSDWYKDPNLTSVKALREDETKSTFDMNIKQETPGDSKDDQGGV